MKRLMLAVALTLITTMSEAQSLYITGPAREGMLEGETYAITWQSEDLKSVSLVAHGFRTPLGGKSRGSFIIVVSKPIPAERGSVEWTVPWIDSVGFAVKLKGYDSAGRLVAIDEKVYHFRPAVMADRQADGIYLALNKRCDQRLYIQRMHRIVKAYICSSSQNFHWVTPGCHPDTPHDHCGVFKIEEKSSLHWSNEYQLPMPNAMRYHGGHFIHGTSSNMYRYLGRPASHGCNRLTRHDAEELFKMTPVGTRVEVIGP